MTSTLTDPATPPAAQAVDTDPPVLKAYRTMIALRRSLRETLGNAVTWLDTPDDVRRWWAATTEPEQLGHP